jgi:hypothetical protein
MEISVAGTDLLVTFSADHIVRRVAGVASS